MARRVVGGRQPLGTNRSRRLAAGRERMRKEEDGRHGLRGRSEVGELVRMRSKRRRRGAVARRVVGGRQPLGTDRSRRLAAGRAEPEACGPMAVKPLRCASERSWLRAQRRGRPPWSSRPFGGRRAGLDAEPVACQCGRPGGARGMRADGGEAVEVRKHEGLAEGTNEEDGRHGLRGCSEVKRRGRPPWSPRMKRTAAMVPEAVRR